MSPLVRRATLAVLLAAASAAPARGAAPAAPSRAAAATRKATIEDDYARALSEAKRRGVPIVIDVWAPW
jgi:hypothetical protein